MTSTPPPFAPSRKGPAPRPPRIMIGTPSPYPMPTSQMQIPQTATTMQGSAQIGAPQWPSYANPFQYMYSQKAGEFMTKGFEGVWDFTKSGMSFGEKFVYGLYGKVSKWSKKWFTHIFLSLVVFLYTIAGALMFKAIEQPEAKKDYVNTYEAQQTLFRAVRDLAVNAELLYEATEEWDGNLINVLRNHKDAVKSFIDNDKTKEELETFHNPWSFWNSMFYCGTIYTTIEIFQAGKPSHSLTKLAAQGKQKPKPTGCLGGNDLLYYRTLLCRIIMQHLLSL